MSNIFLHVSHILELAQMKETVTSLKTKKYKFVLHLFPLIRKSKIVMEERGKMCIDTTSRKEFQMSNAVCKTNITYDAGICS
jgi:hypothetical protein